MAPRTERRSRRGGRQAASTGNPVSEATCLPQEVSESGSVVALDGDVEASPHGISILKEIFPDHDACADQAARTLAAGKAPPPPIHQLLTGIPSPARSSVCSRNAQPGHAEPGVGSVLGALVVTNSSVLQMPATMAPPPPPVPPAPTCQALLGPQQSWELSRGAAPLLPEQGFTSYREKLRAGGRGAFQRAFDVGLMPKSMKQEWHMTAAPSTPTHAFMPQQQAGVADPMQCGQSMGYVGGDDRQQMWSGAGMASSTDSWAVHQPQGSME